MKKYFIGAAALLAFTACSNDETVDLNQDGNVISFAVTANNPSRAADIYCSNNLPGEFTIWASHNEKQYIDGDLVKYEGSKWVNQTGTRYWPATGNVTFLAFENENGVFTYQQNPSTASTLTDFVVSTTVSDQKDFVYARKTQAKSDGTQVTLNFRHALSQIVYKAKNTNPNLFVEINSVSIVNVNSKGDFKFPTLDTNTSYVDHGSSSDATIENQGTWSNLSTLSTFPVTFDNKEIKGNGTAVDLTAENNKPDTGIKEFSSLALLLLPQTTSAWVPSTTTPKPTDETSKTYFKLTCKIRNVRGTAVDANDVYLYGASDAYANIYIPVALNWAQGKKYVYTFTFGNGNGGYDDNGDPVLVPITYTVTVDDFKLGGDQTVNMQTN